MGTPRDLAERMRARKVARGDGFIRQTFSLPREQARKEARAWLDRYPAAAYLSSVESWRELPGDTIEFTMRRLPTAD
jgi:hypothetical protein